MKRNNFLYSLITTFMLSIPHVLWGQPSDSDIPSTILSVDSIVVTSQGDTIYYHKREFFDFGEIYKNQKMVDISPINSILNESSPVQNTTFDIEDIDMTKYVGQIPYTYNVTPTGGKAYTVPIETAVTNGVSPQITISYNSQAGNGLLGMGWSLSGLSSITIINKSIYFDDEVTAPKSTDSNLVFALDGVRLVPSQKLEGYPLETTQGQILVQPVYSERYESAIRYFRVLYPNGTKATYGIDNNKSTTEYSYLITSLEDPKGYRVDFEYTGYYQEVAVISKIKYGGRDANSHPSLIEFQYMNRSDIPTSFVLGHPITMNKLLTKIISYNDNEELRTYTLAYDLNDVYQLMKIECSVGSLSLNPLKFKYGEDQDIAAPDELIKREQMLLSSYFSSTSGMIYQRGRFHKNDYNEGVVIYPYFSNYGLLLTDKFWTPTGSIYSYQYGSTYSPDQAILIAPKLSSLSNVHTIYAGEGFQQLSCADIDGDGVDEFIQLNIIGCYSNGYSALKITVHKYTSAGFFSDYKLYAVDGTVTDGAYTSPIARSYYFGDFNGDGKIELLTISYNSSFKGDVRTSIFTVIDLVTGNILNSQPCFSYGPENADYVYILDYDGDGKSDICHIGSNTADIYSLTKQPNGQSFERICSTNSLKQSNIKGREVQITDYNGDGKQDIIVLPQQSSYYSRPLRVYEFDQGCEEEYEEMKPGHEAYMILRENYPGNRYRLRVCSTNNNSYYVEDMEQTEEILYVDKGDLWEIYLSRGENSFNYKSLNLARTRKDMQYVIMDVNKDGYPDVLQSNSGTVSVYLHKGGVWKSIPNVIEDSFRSTPKLLPVNLCNYGNPTDILMIDKETIVSYSFSKNEGKNRLLTGMTDSYGIYHTNYYTEMTSREVYDPGNVNRTYPYNNLIAPLNLIERASIYNPTEFCNVFQERYKYSGAVIHRTGLGFCGFTKIEVNDEIRGYTTVDEKDPEMFGVSVHTISPMIECNYVYQKNTVGKCVNLLITNMTEFDKLKGDTIVKSYEYDDFYNPVKETVSFTPIIKTITEQTYDNIVTQEKYILGMSRIKKIAQTRDTDLWEESEEISYNSKGFPTQKLVKIKNKQVSKTEWHYDSNWNVLMEKNTPYDATSSINSINSYDQKGRYLVQNQDALARETDYLYYNKYGAPTIVRDFNLHNTYYNFDEFGRTKSITYPDGRVATTTYNWETSIGLYAVTQEMTGAPTQKIYYDVLGREVQIATQRFDGSWQYIKKEYDRRGNLSKVSLPFKSGGTIYWTTYGYDNYGRQTSVVEASGKSVTTTYSHNSVTTNENGIIKICEFDKTGLLIKATDPAGTITYIYRADGQLKEVIAPGNVVTSFEYDSYGRRNKIIDPSAGTQTTNEYYNGYRHIVEQTDANGKTITTNYDLLGRILTQNREEFNTTYSYDSYVHEIGIISSSNNVCKEYMYDSMARVIEEKETVPDGVWLQRNYTYTMGDITKIIYKSSRDNSIATEERIYTNGYLTEIKLNDISIWKLTEENDLGQPIKVTTGPLIRTYDYDVYGIPTTRQVGQLQNFSYLFDPQTGNLLSRTDKKRNITEQFTYDDLNRLVQYGDKVVDYDIKGNIINMEDIGYMSYTHPSKPYAVTDITFTSNLAPRRTQGVLYSSFQRPTVVTDSFSPRFAIKYTYDENGERVRREFIVNTKKICYYLGDCYETEGSSQNSIRSFLYIGGNAYSAPAVYVWRNDSWDIYYICRDYLGSITHVTNSSGELLQELSYDAWGRLRNPENQIVYASGEEPNLTLGRGYTGHEHLPETGLINMNARLYDPAVGRFLSPDPYVQIPDNSQNFNRYSYCLNNPLIYVDESGESILIAAIVGAWIGMGKAMISSDKNGWGLVGDMFKGLLIGGASSAAGAWVGGAVTGLLGSTSFIGGAASGIASGTTSGFIGEIGNSWLLQGDNFVQGLQAGLLGGGISGAMTGIMSGMSGGITAMRHNGNFFTGKGATFCDYYSIDATMGNKIEVGKGMTYSSQYAKEFSDQNFQNVKAVDNLIADGRIARNHVMDGDLVKYKGKYVLGTTISNGVGKGYNVYLYKSAFTSTKQLFLTMGHEYYHAGFNSMGLMKDGPQHAFIRNWEYKHAVKWNFRVEYYTYLNNKAGYLPSSYRNAGAILNY